MIKEKLKSDPVVSQQIGGMCGCNGSYNSEDLKDVGGNIENEYD